MLPKKIKVTSPSSPEKVCFHQAAAHTIIEPAPKVPALARGRMKISTSRFNNVMQCRSRSLEKRLNL
jgi:hypothetical protein